MIRSWISTGRKAAEPEVKALGRIQTHRLTQLVQRQLGRTDPAAVHDGISEASQALLTQIALQGGIGRNGRLPHLRHEKRASLQQRRHLRGHVCRHQRIGRKGQSQLFQTRMLCRFASQQAREQCARAHPQRRPAKQAQCRFHIDMRQGMIQREPRTIQIAAFHPCRRQMLGCRMHHPAIPGKKIQRADAAAARFLHHPEDKAAQHRRKHGICILREPVLFI